ncbi:SDR family oxidoreductase [Photobacterium sp. ZSDE20]|nr:SDR family oxidoreductase [Photobacterium sp. ZSDE20]
MKDLLIFGSSSNITKELMISLKNNYDIKALGSNSKPKLNVDCLDILNIEDELKNYEYFVFNIGVLYPKRILEQNHDEIIHSLKLNLLYIVKCCEFIIENNDMAKIIIVGSESGKKGSYDTSYFLSKAALRAYVREKKLAHKEQQILLISPSVIEDAGMTLRRKDVSNLESNKLSHPKQRLLKSKEVASIISMIIQDKMDYISNTEIEVNGGKFARMD